MDAEKRACQMVADILGIRGPVTLEDGMLTLMNWDSLTHMTIVMALEKEIGRQLSSEEIVSIASLRDIARLLQR